jgi:hypothetical protein
MQVAMSASRVPTVSERNGCYSVSIAAGTTLRWHFKLYDGRLRCVVKIDLPDTLKRYEINVDGQHDQISFPLVH